MKKIIMGALLLLSTSSFSVTPTYEEVRSFVNDEANVAIGILNRIFTKLNITGCSQLYSGRIDEIAIRGSYTEFGFYSEYQAHGPDGDNTWDGIIHNFNVKVIHEQASSGFDRRIKLYLQNSYLESQPVDTTIIGTIIEFSCDMKRGRVLQTGSDGQYEDYAHADMIDLNWDNSDASNPIVEYRLAGPFQGPSSYERASDGRLSATVVDYSSLSNFLTDFGISGYTLNSSGAVTLVTPLLTE